MTQLSIDLVPMQFHGSSLKCQLYFSAFETTKIFNLTYITKHGSRDKCEAHVGFAAFGKWLQFIGKPSYVKYLRENSAVP